MNFAGETFDQARDGARLQAQLEAVRALMVDGRWRTLAEIREALGLPQEARVDSRLRDLRKPKFGRYRVEREWVGRGLWRYQVLPPVPVDRLF